MRDELLCPTGAPSMGDRRAMAAPAIMALTRARRRLRRAQNPEPPYFRPTPGVIRKLYREMPTRTQRNVDIAAPLPGDVLLGGRDVDSRVELHVSDHRDGP